MLARLAAELPFAYVPRFYEPEYFADGRLADAQPHAGRRARDDRAIDHRRSRRHAAARPRRSCRIVECVHDRIAIEIMRGCPWQCRFCQSTVIKRPLRIREVETIVAGGARDISQHGLQRDFAPVALDQRLSPFRAAGPADAETCSARWA